MDVMRPLQELLIQVQRIALVSDVQCCRITTVFNDCSTPANKKCADADCRQSAGRYRQLSQALMPTVLSVTPYRVKSTNRRACRIRLIIDLTYCIQVFELYIISFCFFTCNDIAWWLALRSDASLANLAKVRIF